MLKGVITSRRWSPYAVGAGIGVLSWITFAWMNQALGTSTSFVHAAAAVEGLVAPGHVAENAYFVKTLGTPEQPKPMVNWQVALVAMLAVGAFAAARLGGSFQVERVPGLWAQRFGPDARLRYGAAFVGGAVLLFGARLADGCTSGHAISGGLQLAVSSWVFLASMFASGVVTAFVLFGRKGAGHV